ncbi:hypothetical protein D3C71_1399710 [compost metagenome]
MGGAVVGKVQRPAPVGQPAHDDLVAREHLLAVDAQVLPRLARAARDGQAPGDERCHVAGPAVLHGQAGQVDIGPFPHLLLAGCAARHGVRRHVPQGLEQLAHAQHVLEAFRRLGLLEGGQQFAQGAHAGEVGHTHGAGHAVCGAKQVGEHRHAVARGLGEQQRRAACAQHAIAERCHLQVGRHRLRHAAQIARGFELGHEVAEVAVGHVRFRI